MHLRQQSTILQSSLFWKTNSILWSMTIDKVKHGCQIWQKKSEYRQIGPQTIGPSCPEGPQGRDNWAPGPICPALVLIEPKVQRPKKRPKPRTTNFLFWMLFHEFPHNTGGLDELLTGPGPVSKRIVVAVIPCARDHLREKTQILEQNTNAHILS